MPEPSTSRVAVMGAGLSGVCAALELVEHGCEVDLIEQSDEVITQTSYWNEGKIHLGFVYAKDPSYRTARMMVRGALCFRPLLERWIASDVLDAAVSEPFDYAVHRDTVVAPGVIERYLKGVSEIYDHERCATGGVYLAKDEGPLWEPMSPTQRLSRYDDELITAAYRTQERSIDPHCIASAMRAAAVHAPRLNILSGTTVIGVEVAGPSQVRVSMESKGQRRTEVYPAVINALWQNRLGIDNTAGIRTPRPVIHRYKVGLHSRSGHALAKLPSVTFVTGSFGDAVNFGARSYLNWYSVGHLLSDRNIAPDPRPAEIEHLDAESVIDRTIGAFVRLIPSQRQALLESRDGWTVAGGYITAWGDTGIDDPHSMLHERYQIGVSSFGPLHSVDTGKYTMAPLFAHEACRQILGAATTAWHA